MIGSHLSVQRSRVIRPSNGYGAWPRTRFAENSIGSGLGGGLSLGGGIRRLTRNGEGGERTAGIAAFQPRADDQRAMNLRPLAVVLSVAALALGFSPSALAAGGNYVFAGGNQAQRAEVRAALNASSFNWGIVQQRVTIHLASGVESHAVPGHIWIDTRVLTAGRRAWAIAQHEYAHQVDFLLLDEPHGGASTAASAAATGAGRWPGSSTAITAASGSPPRSRGRSGRPRTTCSGRT